MENNNQTTETIETLPNEVKKILEMYRETLNEYYSWGEVDGDYNRGKLYGYKSVLTDVYGISTEFIKKIREEIKANYNGTKGL